MLSRLTRFSRTLRFSLPAILVLVLQIQFFGGSHPPPWPDEALFSNPAHELARGNGFRTMVLEGLVPGMEEATLWNSPLYMVVLSGAYLGADESLALGRAVSLIIAIVILLVFTGFLQSLQIDAPVLFIAPLLLALDPTFVRGANVIRMDGLCLLFCMLALQFSFRAFQFQRDHYSFLAGVFLGLGALSHPAALYGVAFVVLFHLFRWRGLFFAICGVLLALSPWLAYIASNWDIFQLQFLSQLVRKSGLLTLWGGPTGGVFVVFTSQYGGGFFSMILVGLLVAAVAGQWLWLWKDMVSDNGMFQWKTAWSGTLLAFRQNRYFLLSLAWPAVTLFCMLSVEGWYAMHSFPYLLLGSAALFALPYKESRLRLRGVWILRTFAAGILLLSLLNTYRHLSKDTDEIVDGALERMVQQAGKCDSVFVRMIPDPYFALRASNPDIRYLEFVPARLSFPAESVDQQATLESVDCFILDDTGRESGKADAYIQNNRERFERIPLIFSGPALSGHLYKRISSEK
ncbi:MAG TPA: hypothetical protein DEA96_15670 [Leptospiraceae bacterium]|nr:hypothetical protein [Spirochaetaceae bacterium]HBS06406.1 hypothetical protein [Leptospiraceae bacterium]|tara:strand:+ start:12949 stop:14496 length:1548 start_codon:yes stop_codon:yes gene_type:complete